MKAYQERAKKFTAIKKHDRKMQEIVEYILSKQKTSAKPLPQEDQDQLQISMKRFMEVSAINERKFLYLGNLLELCIK